MRSVARKRGIDSWIFHVRQTIFDAGVKRAFKWHFQIRLRNQKRHRTLTNFSPQFLMKNFRENFLLLVDERTSDKYSKEMKRD